MNKHTINFSLEYSVGYADAKTILKQHNFSAKLPHDLVEIKSVKLLNKKKHQFLMQYIGNRYPLPQSMPMYSLTADRILFSGNYNRFWIIRMIEKIVEHIWPLKYEIEYLKQTINTQP